MALDTVLQVNDTNISVIITITQQDGKTPVDISDSTFQNVYIFKPDRTLITGEAAFVTDGSDGKVQYNIQPGDLDMMGIYGVQASYVVSGNTKHTEKDQFFVESNFPGVT